MTTRTDSAAALRHLRQDLLLALFLVVLCVAMRLLPHVSNFSPVAATALFAGMTLSRRWLAIAVPLAAMLLSDVFLEGYGWRMMAVVYAALVLPAVIGMLARGQRVWPVAIGGALASSLIFYAMTNFAVWALTGLYSTDAKGLLECYVAALPFLKHTVAGDLFWSVALFGGASCCAGGKSGTRNSRPPSPRRFNLLKTPQSFRSAREAACPDVFATEQERVGHRRFAPCCRDAYGMTARTACQNLLGLRTPQPRPQAPDHPARQQQRFLDLGARHRLRVRQLQADHDDAVVGHRMGHELHRAERNGVVRPRRVLDEIEREEVRERRLRVFRRNLQAVDLGQRAERGLARHEEILDQIGLGRRLRRPLGEETVERLHAVRRSEKIDVVAQRGRSQPPPAYGRGRRARPASAWPMTA